MIYNEDFIEKCVLEDIDKVESLLGQPRNEDEGYDDGCDDGSYTMYRTYEEDENGSTLVLYYNSEDRLVHDFEIRNY